MKNLSREFIYKPSAANTDGYIAANKRYMENLCDNIDNLPVIMQKNLFEKILPKDAMVTHKFRPH